MNLCCQKMIGDKSKHEAGILQRELKKNATESFTLKIVILDIQVT